MKLAITGASNFVNRMFEACGPYQWAREFLKNALEALATTIEFGIEWQAVERLGVYRRTVIDNGIGMDAEELYKYFSTLGAGAKKIGGVHDNYGVGARIASLPWNPEGLVVLSYKNRQPSMIWIMLDEESGDYELVEFKTDAGSGLVIDPSKIAWPDTDVDWGAVAPEWIKEHGTMIVLLGSEEQPDTVLGNPIGSERDIKGLSVYLNSRFWDFSEAEVRVVELRSEKKNSWPQGPGDRDDSRRPNNRRIQGARHWLVDVKAPEGKLGASGTIELAEGRVRLEWYLWEGDRPAIHSYAKRGGYIAFRYNGELFQLTQSKVHFRGFGVIEHQVQQNLTLILEPQPYKPSNGRWGVHPDQSRNRMIFTGGGEKGVEPPLSDWAFEFAQDMPPEVLDAIHRARAKIGGTIEDEDYRRRLQDKFGDRWKIKTLVKPKKKQKDPTPATEVDGVLETLEPEFPEIEVPEDRERRKRKRKKTVKELRQKVAPGGVEDGVEREVPVDVPRWRSGCKEEFEKPWHLALWAPNDPDGPTVILNVESPILEEIVRYHQEHYPDVYAEEVTKTVHQVFGEVAACKVAHSQKLMKQVTEQELDDLYRSEPALTIALMGLLAEESLLAQRLGRLGKKKNVA